jgi:hypothetical protein
MVFRVISPVCDMASPFLQTSFIVLAGVVLFRLCSQAACCAKRMPPGESGSFTMADVTYDRPEGLAILFARYVEPAVDAATIAGAAC